MMEIVNRYRVEYYDNTNMIYVKICESFGEMLDLVKDLHIFVSYRVYKEEFTKWYLVIQHESNGDY